MFVYNDKTTSCKLQANFGINLIPGKLTAVLPILILLIYKEILCRGEQCIMIYELNDHGMVPGSLTQCFLLEF